jgi:translation initiation factor 3 subunit L
MCVCVCVCGVCSSNPESPTLSLFPGDAPRFDLPNIWLWDIIDEFLNQFQSFHTFRNKVSALKDHEVDMLKGYIHVWCIQSVVRYLHALVKKGGFDPLTGERREIDSEDRIHESFRSLAMYASVGLLRIHAMMGDYQTALKAVGAQELQKKVGKGRCVRVKSFFCV